MDWQELPKAKAYRIALQKNVENIQDPAQTEEAYRLYKEKAESMKRVFPEFVCYLS